MSIFKMLSIANTLILICVILALAALNGRIREVEGPFDTELISYSGEEYLIYGFVPVVQDRGVDVHIPLVMEAKQYEQLTIQRLAESLDEDNE